MAYIFSGAYIPLSCKLIEQVGPSALTAPCLLLRCWRQGVWRRLKPRGVEILTRHSLCLVVSFRFWSETAGQAWKKSPGYSTAMNLLSQVRQWPCWFFYSRNRHISVSGTHTHIFCGSSTGGRMFVGQLQDFWFDSPLWLAMCWCVSEQDTEPQLLPTSMVDTAVGRWMWGNIVKRFGWKCYIKCTPYTNDLFLTFTNGCSVFKCVYVADSWSCTLCVCLSVFRQQRCWCESEEWPPEDRPGHVPWGMHLFRDLSTTLPWQRER